jgi:hypothetical protein
VQRLDLVVTSPDHQVRRARVLILGAGIGGLDLAPPGVRFVHATVRSTTPCGAGGARPRRELRVSWFPST